ncbi:MAG TPA: hypothetical protein VF796_13005, partial [Humisphaera sp.]
FDVDAGDGAGPLEVAVTRFPAGMPWDQTVNMWRGQVGAAPLPAVNEADLPKVSTNGGSAVVYDVAGPTDAQPTKRLRVAAVTRGGATYFFKMAGPPAAVAARQASFDAFLRSLSFKE